MNQIQCRAVRKRFLRHPIAQVLRRVATGRGFSGTDWFWALDGVDLAIAKPGARLGIVGLNGSGKTTLLRIIAGVTNPTSGTIMVNGRVAPLLEPVVGLQPDLTGRENISLLGAILGMRHREIHRKLDSIVALAQVENFLDMPLKHYSLGMAMRLGFSVAIHVAADILLLDEAWGIADQGFQVKSIEQIQRLQAQGVTSIIVSHDPDIIRRLSSETLWLEAGRAVRFGPTEEIVSAYTAAMMNRAISSAGQSG